MLPSPFNGLNLGIFVCVVIIVSLLLFFLLVDVSAKTRSSLLPGLDATDPDKGNLEDIQDAGSLYEFSVNLHADCGPLASFWWRKQLVVSFGSPELFSKVKDVFDRPPLLFEAFSYMIGKKSIQYANGTEGRKRRQLMDPSFSHQAVIHYYDHFLKITSEIADKWSSLPADQHIPLSEYMISMSVKAVAISVLGQEMSDENELLKLRNAFEICSEEEENQSKGSMPKEGDGRMERYQKNRDLLRDMIMKIIKKRRAEKNKDDHIFLDSLLDADFIDEEELVDQAMTFMVGGFHTTGNLMTWCLYFLATHQGIQEKVYQEMMTALGTETITAQIIPELTYTRQVVDETMRCSVLAPWAARFTDHDLQIGEHLILKETPIILALGVVLKDEDIWHDPDRFDPERFNIENRKRRHPMAFQPFGFAGKRKCPGYRFSYAEAFVALSVLIRRFTIQLVEGQVIEPVYGFVTSPSNEIWVTVSKR